MRPFVQEPLTRRQALSGIGSGIALAGLAAIAGRAVGATGSGSPQPFALPPLGYSYDALEPHIDARTMEIHHSKHHQAYVNNANTALKSHSDLQGMSGEELLRKLERVPESIRASVRNNVGGHVNHAFFWKLISPVQGMSIMQLGVAIAEAFGSMDEFKKQFAAAATGRFGSGWAWLSMKSGKLVVHSTPNQDSPISDGMAPIIGLDVWEHAYYLKYQNRRADYVAAFWNILNWTQAEVNYAEAKRGHVG